MNKYATIGAYFTSRPEKKLLKTAYDCNSYLYFSGDQMEFMEFIASSKPDYILIDYQKVDCYEILKHINIISPDSNIKFVSKTCMVSHSNMIATTDIKELLQELRTTKIKNRFKVTEYNENDVYLFLMKLGFSTRQCGFQFLKEAICVCWRNSGFMENMRLYTYPQVARKFNKTPYSVAKAIERTVESAYFNSDKGWDTILGFTYNHKPTAKEFISCIVQKMLLEHI